MHRLLQDIRFGIRLLSKNATSTVIALLSLSLAIGAATAIFSVVYGALIDPFPYKDMRHVWVPRILSVKGTGGRFFNTVPEYEAIAKLPIVRDVMASGFSDLLVDSGAGPDAIRGVQMSGNAFAFLGVNPLLGRTVGPQDIHPGGEPEHVVVLSFRQWRRIFSGDRGVIGRSLRINDEPYTIIGVMPPRFTWFGRDSIWLPLRLDLRNTPALMLRLRLRDDATQKTATESLQALFTGLAKDYPKTFPREGFKTLLVPFMDQTVASGQLRTSLYLLLSAVGLLLLIGCANVANLQLVRATVRQKEMAVRLSVGADRARLIRQLLTESVILAIAGGALGVLLAFAVLKSVVSLIPDVYIPNEAVISVNGWVLTFSTAISMLTGILFGLAPALQASKQDLNESLKDSGKGTPGTSRGGATRQILVVAEVALSVILLVGAGLTMRTFLSLESVPVGFQPGGLLYMDIALNPKRYVKPEQRNNAFQQISAKLEALPGVQGVSAGTGGFPFGGPLSGFKIAGKTATPDRRVHVAFVSDAYLRTMKIPLIRGRMFTEQDVAHAEPVGLINQTGAAELWPNEDPVGKRISLDLLKNAPPGVGVPSQDLTITVLGVIGDMRNEGLRESTKPGLFVPYSIIGTASRTIALRASTDPRRLLNAIRGVVLSIDKELPIGRSVTAEESIDSETVGPRFTMILFAFFGLIGIALAAIGIYSVLAYTVSQRTHEIGIRMALGAEAGDILSLVLRMGLQLVAIGLGIGLLVTLFLTKLIQTQLFGVTSHDPASFVTVTAILLFIALLACYVPARRATKLDPSSALRHE